MASFLDVFQHLVDGRCDLSFEDVLSNFKLIEHFTRKLILRHFWEGKPFLKGIDGIDLNLVHVCLSLTHLDDLLLGLHGLVELTLLEVLAEVVEGSHDIFPHVLDFLLLLFDHLLLFNLELLLIGRNSVDVLDLDVGFFSSAIVPLSEHPL